MYCRNGIGIKDKTPVYEKCSGEKALDDIWEFHKILTISKGSRKAEHLLEIPCLTRCEVLSAFDF